MHSVAALTDQHPSDAGATAAPELPIGRYRRVPVQVYQADPHAPQVGRRLIALIATRWPATPAEHVGSSAVPGLAGKGTIDLLLPADTTDVPAVTEALLGLGFQPQVPAAFPASRPMLWGAFRHGGTDYRVHVHVVPASSPEVAAMRGFRDALRADPRLRCRYAALKRAIVEDGPVDPVVFSNAKHDWIVAALGQLGLVVPRQQRLYEDAPAWTACANWPHDANRWAAWASQDKNGSQVGHEAPVAQVTDCLSASRECVRQGVSLGVMSHLIAVPGGTQPTRNRPIR